MKNTTGKVNRYMKRNLKKLFVSIFITVLSLSLFTLNISAASSVTTKSKYYYSYYSTYIVYGQPQANGSVTYIALKDSSGASEDHKIQFEKYVNSIQNLESKIENARGKQALTEMLALALVTELPPVAFAAYLASLGYGNTASNYGGDLLEAMNNADVYFYRLKKFYTPGYRPGCSPSGNTWICPYSVPTVTY